MTVMLCVDDKNGMLFNHRRQSQDRILQQHILDLAGSHRLWMSPYSRKQFAETGSADVMEDEEYLDKAGSNDYCFVEDRDISPYAESIDTIILFRWNRIYPADTYFTLDISKWTKEKSEDFAGYSHKKITKEIYRK